MTKNLLFAIKRQHFLTILRKDTLIYTTVSADLMNNSILLPAFSKFTQGIFSHCFLSFNSLNCPYRRTTAAFSAFFLCTRLTGCISHSAGRHSPFGCKCSNRTILHRLMQKDPQISPQVSDICSSLVVKTSIAIARSVITAIRTVTIHSSIVVFISPVCIDAIAAIATKTSLWNHNFLWTFFHFEQPPCCLYGNERNLVTCNANLFLLSCRYVRNNLLFRKQDNRKV